MKFKIFHQKDTSNLARIDQMNSSYSNDIYIYFDSIWVVRNNMKFQNSEVDSIALTKEIKMLLFYFIIKLNFDDTIRNQEVMVVMMSEMIIQFWTIIAVKVIFELK